MKRMKIAVLALAAIMMVFGLAACGGGDNSDESKKDEKKTFVTYEDYDKLVNTDGWGDMTLDEVNDFFGVEGTLDEESTKDMGEGYEVYRWSGEKEGDGTILVTFKDKNGGGNKTISSVSTSLSKDEDKEE